MTTPTTLPEALTEIEELRGQVQELLRLLGQEAPEDTGAASLSTSEITGLNGGPEIPFVQASLERKQTGHAQAQTLAELRNVLETPPDVIFTLDLHGNLAGWNKRLETVTGLVPEELTGRPAISFVPEGEHEQTAAVILRAFEEGYAELEGHLLTKDQRAIAYHWTGAALRNDEGQVVGIKGVGRDVSEKKRIEAELRQQHLLAAHAMAHVGSWDWDIVSGAIEWSEEQFRIFGYEPKAIPVTYETFLAALYPDDHDRAVASINDTLEGKTALKEDTVVFFTGSALLLLGIAVWRLVRQRREWRFQSKVIAATGCGVVMTDARASHHPVTHVNPAFRLLTGYTDSEIVGKTMAILAGPGTDRPRWKSLSWLSSRTLRLFDCSRFRRRHGACGC